MNSVFLRCRKFLAVFLIFTIFQLSSWAASLSDYSDAKLDKMSYSQLVAARKNCESYYNTNMNGYYTAKKMSESNMFSDIMRSVYRLDAANYHTQAAKWKDRIIQIDYLLKTKDFTPTLTSVTVSGVNRLQAGESTALTCRANYSNDTSTVVSPSWKISNSSWGSMSGNTFTAKKAGIGKTVTVTATYSGKQATFNISIVKPTELSYFTVTGSTTVNVGQSMTLTCKAFYSDGSTKLLTPNWKVSKSSYGTMNGNTFTALKGGAGKTVTLTASYQNKKTTFKISIPQPVTLSSLTIGGNKSVAIGASATLTCYANYSDGNQQSVTPVWSVSNPSYGAISGNTFTAFSAGAGKTVTVTATYEGKKATFKIAIPQPTTLSSLTVSGNSVVVAEHSLTLSCTAKYSDKSTKNVTPTWSVSNDSYGSMIGNTFTATRQGIGKTVTVTAVYQGKKTTFKFKIVEKATVKSLTIIGRSTIAYHSTDYYSCEAVYNDGTTQTITPEWSISKKSYGTLGDGESMAGAGTCSFSPAYAGIGKTVTLRAKYQGKTASLKLKIESAASLKTK